MSCYRPLEAYRNPLTGEVWIGGNATKSGRFMELPCGRCIGCKLDRARAWSVRIQHEAQLYDSNWFVTWTYRNEDLPGSLSLEYDDFRGMMKRLRERCRGASPGPKGNYPLRFFCAGEYGSLRKRPHFHSIMFNLRTGDEKPLGNGSFSSKLLEDVWQKGNVQLDVVTDQSASYVSGYALKKVYGRNTEYEDVVNLSTGEVTRRRKEFVVMSRKPGIGAWWYERFAADLFPGDQAVVVGRRSKVPGYYWRRYRTEGDPAGVAEVECTRFWRAENMRAESGVERRAVREEVAQRQVDFFNERADL